MGFLSQPFFASEQAHFVFLPICFPDLENIFFLAMDNEI